MLIFTITASDNNILYSQARHMSKKELCLTGSYPLDYNFGTLQPKYLIGMSVPPVMTAQLSHQIYLQWFKS
jgi:DNA (cytosine-5)-methyltransferase 1